MPTSLSSYSYLALAFLVLTSQIGCIALSIPSERMYDPGDHGGILGDWEVDQAEGCSSVSCGHHSDSLSGVCFDGGPLDCDPLDPSFDEDGNPKPEQEEVPWPRYHPVPTRPVFGGTAIEG